MPRSYLRLRFWDEGDGTGELFARAEADGFAGEGSAYFPITELKEFAQAVSEFPLPSNDKRLSLASGFANMDGRGGLDQEHLAINVYAVDTHGYIGLQIRMATQVSESTRPESQKAAKIEIVTTYEPLSRFGKDLLAVLQGKANEASLEGESIGWWPRRKGVTLAS